MVKGTQKQKRETHARMVHAASRVIRDRGIDGLSVAELMAEIGLTHGGFYKHFASREALIEEAAIHAFGGAAQAMQKRSGHSDDISLAEFSKAYLSPDHRDHPADGCPFAALSSDLSRGPDGARYSLTSQLDEFARWAASKTGGDRAEGLSVVALMVGALTLARATIDEELSREILSGARRQIKRLTIAEENGLRAGERR